MGRSRLQDKDNPVMIKSYHKSLMTFRYVGVILFRHPHQEGQEIPYFSIKLNKTQLDLREGWEAVRLYLLYYMEKMYIYRHVWCSIQIMAFRISSCRNWQFKNLTKLFFSKGFQKCTSGQRVLHMTFQGLALFS